MKNRRISGPVVPILPDWSIIRFQIGSTDPVDQARLPKRTQTIFVSDRPLSEQNMRSISALVSA